MAEEDPLAELLRRTGLDPRPGFEDELVAHLGDGGRAQGAAAPRGAAPARPAPLAGPPLVGAVPSSPSPPPPSRGGWLAAAAVVAVLAFGLVGFAVARSLGGDVEDVSVVDAPPTTGAPDAGPGVATSSPPEGPTMTTAGPAGSPTPTLWSTTVSLTVPPGWAGGSADGCPAPAMVAWFEDAAAEVGRCDGEPGPWIVLEPLPVDLGATASSCVPAPLADGSVACEETAAGGELRRVLVDGEDILVTAHSPSDPAVAAALRSIERTAVTGAGESQPPPAAGATAALETALGPALVGGCGALDGPPAVGAACSALGLDGGGASLAGASFVPGASAEDATYVVDVALGDGSLRSAEVDLTYVWDRNTRRGSWQVTDLRPR